MLNNGLQSSASDELKYIWDLMGAELKMTHFDFSKAINFSR